MDAELVLIFVGIVVVVGDEVIDVEWWPVQVVKNPYAQSCTGKALEKGAFLDILV
ncbi:MAG: hypothetical protein QXR60_02680 [Candidatus Nanoarchaeia archaeon]